MRNIALIICIISLGFQLGAIDISGNQSGTWIPANNPHQLIGDVTVPAGETLTISPGVIVQAMGNFRINAVGTIQAIGTETDSIYFYNLQNPPTTIWKGIRLENPTLVSNFQHCYIEYAEYGINAVNAPVAISNCHFKLNRKGMQLYGIGSTNPAVMNVHHNLIEWGVQNGIYIAQNSNAWVHHNEIRHNGTGTQFYAAIQLANQAAGGANNPIIEYNHIHHNYKQGISAWDVANANAINPTIQHNIIEYNYTGVYLLQSSGYIFNNQINNNFIPGDMNSGAGVMVSGVTSQPYFEDNVITGNYTGFYITNNAMPVLGDLSIYHAWAQGGNLIANNIDANGILHSVYCDAYANSGNIIKAENNFWGVDTAAEIAIGINDHNDNPALPTVDFDPWQVETQESTLTGGYAYLGEHTLQQVILQLIDIEDHSVLAQYPILETPFTVTTDVTGSFYAALMAHTSVEDVTLYGCAGGFTTPMVYSTVPGEATALGLIEIEDMLPPRWEKVGAPEIVQGQLCYPVYKGMGVWQWDTIDYLYEQGDYYYIVQHKYRSGGELLTHNFMPPMVYDKFQNWLNGDTWSRHYVVGGVARQTFMMHWLMVNPYGQGADAHIFTETGDRFGVLSKTIVVNGTRELLTYDADGYVNHRYLIYQSGAPLNEGSMTYYLSQELDMSPTRLTFTNETYNTLLLLWQAPAYSGHDFTHYRVYMASEPIPGTMIAEIPFDQSEYPILDFQPTATTYFCVTASNGTYESEPTNWICVIIISNEDEVMPAPRVSMYPNPVSFSRGESLKLKLEGYSGREPKLEVFNSKGQLVYQGKAVDDTPWYGRDLSGKTCGTGIYFLRITAENAKPITRKLVIMK